MNLGILYTDAVKEYDFGEGHPFRGNRYQRFLEFFSAQWPTTIPYHIMPAQKATDSELGLICDPSYIAFTRQYYREAHSGLVSKALRNAFHRFQSSDNRPRRNPGNLEEAATYVIGQAKMGIDFLQTNKFQCVVSIGGGMHHAKPNYGEGFCLYNDVAFATRYLIHEYGLNRIAIIDTDAHAGNGTMDYFYADPQVLFIDIHQDPETLYPGTGLTTQIGVGDGQGYTINVPLPIFAGDASYQMVFDEIVHPLIQEFQPQMIIRNGGADPHFADALTSLGLTVNGFHMIGTKVRHMADEQCNGKVLDLLASGYNQHVLPVCWLAIIAGLTNTDVTLEEPAPLPARYSRDFILTETQLVIHEIKTQLKDFWGCFSDPSLL